MNVEQVNSNPARWYTLLGLLLVPLLVAGGFLFAGVDADSRTHTVRAAVVNLDEPVTINGQYTPLGRQLTANLVDSDREENLTWVLESEANARAGLTTGSFAAMVVIPENFSAAATSFSKDADEAEQATIQVHTSPVAGVADATLGKLVASEAAATLNQTLTEGYLDGIYIGFNDLGEQFTTIADGSGELADGAEDLADGIGQAADGSQELYTGARQLADGLGTMAAQTKTMPKDVRKLANGAGEYVAGVNQLVTQSAAGQQTMISTVQQFENGAEGLSAGLRTYQQSMRALGNQSAVTGPAVSAAKGAAAAADCPTYSDDPTTQASMCAAFKAGSVAGAAIGANVGVNAGGQAAAAGLETVVDDDSVLSGADKLAGGLAQFRQGLEAAANDKDTAAQLKQLTAGGTQLAAGTDELADGLPALVNGIAKVADGSVELADGVDQLGAGLIEAADGSTQLADGMRQLADGIAEGKDKLPSYTKSDRESLATVVAAPIDTGDLKGLADPDLGWISLVLVLALWLGALAIYVVVKALGSGLLTSAEPTAVLIARSLLPGVIVISAQAVVVAVLGQVGLDLTPQKGFAVAGVLLLAGVTFVLINHALVAWLGGLGRIISVLFAVLTGAAALVGTAPGLFAALRPFSPLTPALDAVRAIVTESAGATTSTLTLVGWLLVGLLASSIAVARRRTTTLTAVLATA